MYLLIVRLIKNDVQDRSSWFEVDALAEESCWQLWASSEEFRLIWTQAEIAWAIPRARRSSTQQMVVSIDWQVLF